MFDPFDKARCSFPVPDFCTDEEQRKWNLSLTPEQRLELVYWMNVFRYGEEAVNRPIDRAVFKSMTLEEFNADNEEAFKRDEAWRAAHRLPARTVTKSDRHYP